MPALFPTIEPEWNAALSKEFSLPYFLELMSFLKKEKKYFTIYPQEQKIFAAFEHTPFNKVKVVVLGQDPYHGEGQANGLCFSVSDCIKPPPSLVNIFKELKTDIGCPIPKSGNLEKWADQGVLLLNATLTVRANEAGSHQKKGWEQFTNAAIKQLSEKRTGLVFLLWGRFAQMKEELIDKNKHYILSAAHPSPLARGKFFGCKHFSKTNSLLKQQGLEEIDWCLDQ